MNNDNYVLMAEIFILRFSIDQQALRFAKSHIAEWLKVTYDQLMMTKWVVSYIMNSTF